MDCISEIKQAKRTIVFGDSLCGFTQAAIRELPDSDILFFDKQKQGEMMKDYLKTELNHNTVPLIFVKGEFVGGYSNLRNSTK